MWVVNDAGIVYLPGGARVVISVFSRGTERDLSPGELRTAIANAEDRIAEIAKVVFDYYTAK